MELLGRYQVVKDAEIGEGTKVWHFVNLYGCKIGKNCIISSFVEIEKDVKIGDNCKIEAFTYIPTGVTIEDDVFLGPRVTFTNDKHPKIGRDWQLSPTLVKKGAAIGAGAVIVCGVTIGENAVVGAGSVVTKDVASGTTVVGNPAKVL
jgi:acetyltransferase-like isoleucine patch superfamily enzyme